jgi:hypothetical protein
VGLEVDHSPLSSAEVKNDRSCTSYHLGCLHYHFIQLNNCHKGMEDISSSSCYSTTALSVWPWLPLQLMPIPLYPMPLFSIVSHQAHLNHLVVFLNLSGILYMVSEQLIFLGWGCQPYAQPPAILEDRCFLSGLSPQADQSQF